MPAYYYAVRETDSYQDVTLHADRDCPDGPARAAPPRVRGTECPDCLATDDTPAESDTDSEMGGIERATTAELIDRGECPWCDDYEGDYVGQHASSQHPDAWTAYRDA